MTKEYFERLVDTEALADYLTDLLGPAETYDVRRHAAGHSNETLFVEWGEHDLVIRRPPPGKTADTAHDVLREYRVMDRLQETAVPVPQTIAASADHDVIGSDFFIVERLHGSVLRDKEPPVLATADTRQRVGMELVQALGNIHSTEYQALGLDDFGRPTGYTNRQISRWRKQIDWAVDVTAADREVPGLEEIGDWLEAHAPEEHPETLVHGDYKLDNVMYDEDGTLIAIFDWEMATLGDPRADLGWLLSYWRDANDPEPAVPELATRFVENDAYPTRRDLVDRWEAVTGYTFDHERFYRTLAVYKFAALGEMFYRRYLEGNSDDPLYPTMEDGVPALAERGLDIIAGDESL